MTRSIAIVIALVGCYREASTPAVTAPAIGKHGMLWATKPVAWQLSTSALAIDGATALAAGDKRAIARIVSRPGCRSGGTTSTPRSRCGSFKGDGRWLVVGSNLETAQTEAYVLDGKTLAPRQTALPNAPDHRSYAFASSAITS